MPKVPSVHQHCGIHPKLARKEIKHLCDQEIEYEGSFTETGMNQVWTAHSWHKCGINLGRFLLTPNEPDENTTWNLLRPGEELEMLMGSTFNFYHLHIFPVIMVSIWYCYSFPLAHNPFLPFSTLLVSRPPNLLLPPWHFCCMFLDWPVEHFILFYFHFWPEEHVLSTKLFLSIFSYWLIYWVPTVAKHSCWSLEIEKVIIIIREREKFLQEFLGLVSKNIVNYNPS